MVDKGCLSIVILHITSPYFSPAFVARTLKRCCVGAHTVEDDAGVADTTSNRLERVGPVTTVSRRPQQEAGEICGLDTRIHRSKFRRFIPINRSFIKSILQSG